MKRSTHIWFRVLFSVLFLGLVIGYAQLSDSMRIDGNSTFTPPNCVYIIDVSSTANLTVSAYGVTTINSRVDLSNGPVTFTVTILNNANVPYAFNVQRYLIGAQTYDNENIEFVTNMTRKEFVVASGERKTFTVTAQFKKGADNSNKILNSIVNYEFLPLSDFPEDEEQTTVSDVMGKFEQILNDPDEGDIFGDYSILTQQMQNNEANGRPNSNGKTYIGTLRGASDDDRELLEELFEGNLNVNINGTDTKVTIMIKREDVYSKAEGDEMTIYMTTSSLTSMLRQEKVYAATYAKVDGKWVLIGQMFEGQARANGYDGGYFGTGSFDTGSWKSTVAYGSAKSGSNLKTVLNAVK